MAFVVHERPAFHWADPIPEGQASIDKTGTLTIRTEDLALAQIEGTAIVLTDELTMRIALRAPREHERAKAYTVFKVFRAAKKLDPKWRRIGLGGVIKAMNLEPAAVAGRCELITKENLLIVNLTGADGDENGEEKA